MTSAIKGQIQEDTKTAMRNRETERLATIRLISAALKQREVDERIELSDADVIAVLDKMLKQRRESIAQYEAANRQDLVDKEAAEAKIIQSYLPPQLSTDEINQLIDTAIKESGATSAKDIGKIMTILRPQLQGRADMASVSNQVKDRLN